MPDILIGNVRGQKGDTGAQNTIIASVYEFAISNSGTVIPQGTWSPTIPESEEGDWVWCRNTLTWDEGPDSIIYTVGYHGKDGAFNGQDLVENLQSRVQELEDRTTPISKGGTEATTLAGAQAKLGITAANERIDALNDATTGINLLRGTRDFKIGTQGVPFNTTTNTDGFYSNLVSGTYSIYRDGDGFAVLNISRENASTSTAAMWSSAIRGISGYEEFTISVDFMVDDVSKFNDQNIFRIAESTESGHFNSYSISIPQTSLGDTSIKSNQWYRVVYHYRIPDSAVKNLSVGVTLRINGSVHYRKFKVERGHINHPVWSPSPFDVATVDDKKTLVRVNQGTGEKVSSYVWLGRNIAELHADSIGDQEPIAWLQSITKNGTFINYDLQIGDYLPVTLNNGSNTVMNYQLAGFDTYYNAGNPSNPHMITLVPTLFYDTNIHFNETNTNQGTAEENSPWRASNLFKWCNETFYSWLPEAWQNALLDIAVSLPTRYSSASSLQNDTGYKWGKLGKVWVPSEIETRGFIDRSTPDIPRIDKQFPIFERAKRVNRGVLNYWLREARSNNTSDFLTISGDGFVSPIAPTSQYPRPLPCFHIG